MDNLEKKDEVTVDAQFFRAAIELARFVASKVDACTFEPSVRGPFQVLAARFQREQLSQLLPDWLRKL